MKYNVKQVKNTNSRRKIRQVTKRGKNNCGCRIDSKKRKIEKTPKEQTGRVFKKK